jgi:hypothetical protein
VFVLQLGQLLTPILMESVSSIQAVYAIALSIKNWLDAQGLKEKESVIRSISHIVDRIQEALAPFVHSKDISARNERIELDSNLDSSFNGMRDVLTRTKEHLIAWRRKKPNLKGFSGLLVFFGPGQVLNALKQDEADLNHQMIPMLLSVNHLLREKSTSLVPGSGEKASLAGSGSIDDRIDGSDKAIVTSGQISEVGEFWKDYIGLKVRFHQSSCGDGSLPYQTDPLGSQGHIPSLFISLSLLYPPGRGV